MLRSLLIANRGEIALRIIRTARRLGIRTIAVASEPDRAMPFARAADVCVPIGPGPATESYLDMAKVIGAARETGAQAIHPGYGFLSENADFAAAVKAAGLVFVGPSAEAMRALGGKAAAKRIAIGAGVPVVPGYQGEEQDPMVLAEAAAGISYPVMIKAVAGGGGRGMRLVERAEDFRPLLESARREAAGAFGDDRVLIEKVVQRPRHVEVQVFGDSHGNVVHLFERDCTLQRRNQKVIEEAPAPGMSAELRARITAAAVKLAKAVGYEGAGTVEFLVEGGSLGPKAPWYFIEMNTRLQVEHPVTEEITGLDLVEWQLRIASGERLPLAQEAITMRGHAVEARLCAEDPASGFQPSVGLIDLLSLPDGEGLRMEAGVETGSQVSPFYDSMVAKLIASGPDRETALGRLVAALAATRVLGPTTNAGFLARLAADPEVVASQMDTGLIGRRLAELTRRDEAAERRAAAAGTARLLASRRPPPGPGLAGDPWATGDAFMLGASRRQRLQVAVDGEPRELDLAWRAAGLVEVDGHGPFDSAHIDGATLVGGKVYVPAGDREVRVEWPTYDLEAHEAGDGSAIRAPINGRVAKLMVAEGQAVEKGQRIAVVEAMKMEHVLVAPVAGRIERLAVTEGQQVAQRALIAAIVT
jgi:3-methylcrotonyl-CoA carboxylase alpha subunit